MVIARRSVSAFLAVWGVSSLFFGCVKPTVLYLILVFPPRSACVTPQATLETWGLAAPVVLVAAVLWVAPWRRFIAERARGGRSVPSRLSVAWCTPAGARFVLRRLIV